MPFIKGQPRPAGAGRKPGQRNRATIARSTRLKALEIEGHDPITFFADSLKNKALTWAERFACAKELAPYMRPRLAAIEAMTGAKTHEQRLAEIQQLLIDAASPQPLLINGSLPDPGGEGETGEGGGG